MRRQRYQCKGLTVITVHSMVALRAGQESNCHLAQEAAGSSSIPTSLLRKTSAWRRLGLCPKAEFLSLVLLTSPIPLGSALGPTCALREAQQHPWPSAHWVPKASTLSQPECPQTLLTLGDTVTPVEVPTSASSWEGEPKLQLGWLELGLGTCLPSHALCPWSRAQRGQEMAWGGTGGCGLEEVCLCEAVKDEQMKRHSPQN